MSTTTNYQAAIANLAKDAGWISMARMNTSEGVKFPLMNERLGAVVVPTDNGEDYWLMHGSEQDVKAWDDLMVSVANAPVIRDFMQYVEEFESYSIEGDTISDIVLDAWWWSEWAEPVKG